MFTGIVEEMGAVRGIRPGRLTVGATAVLDGTRLGDSIAINGACLTVTALLDGAFAVDVMPETLRRTNLGSLRLGDGVNLERALALGGRIGGHFVQGHVEATGRVAAMTPEGNAVIARFTAPPEAMRYVVPKGFIAVDGVSLTVVDADGRGFSVSLVGFTREQTTLGRRRPGDVVNLETDVLAKYVAKALATPGQGLTEAFLAEHGFTS